MMPLPGHSVKRKKDKAIKDGSVRLSVCREGDYQLEALDSQRNKGGPGSIYIFIYVYRSLSRHLVKGLRKNIRKKNEKLESTNYYEMAALHMKKK